jgi:prevent-host-death family protein
MHRIGSFQVKTHLSQLLQRVEGGEEITITRRGVDVARLVPIAAPGPAGFSEAAQGLRELREELRSSGKHVTRREIQTWIKEGRP